MLNKLGKRSYFLKEPTVLVHCDIEPLLNDLLTLRQTYSWLQRWWAITICLKNWNNNRTNPYHDITLDIGTFLLYKKLEVIILLWSASEQVMQSLVPVWCIVEAQIRHNSEQQEKDQHRLQEHEARLHNQWVLCSRDKDYLKLFMFVLRLAQRRKRIYQEWAAQKLRVQRNENIPAPPWGGKRGARKTSRPTQVSIAESIQEH